MNTEVEPVGDESTYGGVNVNAGKTMQRMQTQYATAIQVQKPRDLDKIVKALDRECEYGADSFFYSMVFKSKKGPSVVEGPSIGLAYAMLRTWGNCAIEMPPSAIEETDTHFMVNPSFVDLENGVTITRAFRQVKDGGGAGRFDPERKQDIAFQVAQSKASRNVICAGIPRWLVDRCVRLAKEAVEKGINAEGVVNAAQKAVKIFASLGVSEEQIVAKIGRPMSQWTSSDVAGLRGDYSAIKSGEASVADLFPIQAAPSGTGPLSVDSVLNAQVAPAAPTKPAPAADPVAASADDKPKRGRPRKVVPAEAPAEEPAPAAVVEEPVKVPSAPAPAPSPTPAPAAPSEEDLRARFRSAIQVLSPTMPDAMQRAFAASSITSEMVKAKQIPSALVEKAVLYLEAQVAQLSRDNWGPEPEEGEGAV
jgi:hypothetical protein